MVRREKEIGVRYEKKGIIFELKKAVLSSDGIVEVEMFINGERRYGRLREGQIITFWDVKIGRQKVNGVRVEDADIWNRICGVTNELREEYEKMRQEDLAYVPKYVEVAEGEESARLYIFADTPNGIEKPRIVSNIESKMQAIRHKVDIQEILKELVKEGSAEEVKDTGHFLALWDYKVDFPVFAKKISELWEELMGRRIREEEQRREEFRKRAKETGEPQEMYRYADDCNDPNLECDVDIVVVFMNPDGSITEKRIHTF